MDITIDLDTARPMARSIQSRLAKLGIDVSLGQAYEVLAAAAGEPEWNVLSAKLKAVNAGTDAPQPTSMCVVIDLIEPTDPKFYQDTYGISPAMLVEAAETFVKAYYQDPNPTAEVVRENFTEYMSDLIAGRRGSPSPEWAEEWQAARRERPLPR